MMAVVLAGGKGTRLRPFTVTIPKPLLPLGDVPVAEVVVRQLASAGFDRIVFTLGHMAHLLRAFFDNGSRWGVKIEYCYEREPLGTAGPLAFVEDLEDAFLVMNGDLLTAIDYAQLVATHIERDAWGTIAVKKREVKIDFGVVVSTESGRLESYVEKPTLPYDVSTGVNVLSRRCLEFIPRGRRFDMPDLMRAMHNAGKPVFCERQGCYWQDIGRFDDYEQASEDFAKDPSQFLPNSRAKELARTDL